MNKTERVAMTTGFDADHWWALAERCAQEAGDEAAVQRVRRARLDAMQRRDDHGHDPAEQPHRDEVDPGGDAERGEAEAHCTGDQ